MTKLLDQKRSLYIVGIKGVGMTAIAQILHVRGHRVSGSDVAEHFFTDTVLREAGIKVFEGFDPNNLPKDIDAVIYSTAYSLDHPELQEAQQRGIPLRTYPEILGELFLQGEGIAVAGTHGKTTTTALLGVLLTSASADPTVVVGSHVRDFSGNARVGRSRLLVVETDEYQNKFTHYTPQHLVLTNIEYDHPDFFPTPESYVLAFQKFIERIPKNGIIVAGTDDANVSKLMRHLDRPIIRFGIDPQFEYQVVQTVWVDGAQSVVLSERGEQHTLRLPLPGKHNALNLAAAVAFARSWGVTWDVIEQATASFQGIARRFEFKGMFGTVPIIDDYAHHPSEISAALNAAGQEFPQKRVVAVFQPHTYSRTKALLKEFAASLTADCVILLEVYGSAREKEKTVSSNEILSAMNRPDTLVVEDLDRAEEKLRSVVRDGDVLLLLGAGDVWQLAGRLLKSS